jgi:hypothetical protein
MPAPAAPTFWSLMDRWCVPDDQALETVAYDGVVPTTSKRPRFKLNQDQARIVQTLLEIDRAMAAAGMDPAWLRRKDRTTGRTPIDLLRAGEAQAVLATINRMALEASVRSRKRGLFPES